MTKLRFLKLGSQVDPRTIAASAKLVSRAEQTREALLADGDDLDDESLLAGF